MTMSRDKLSFSNAEGHQLAGLLELPSGAPHGFVLFAHCFTCGKDIAAASRIARALASRGFATLRFDFTGLGGSDGDFANSNFSSNVADLVAAADYLRTHRQAPMMLIGHSLGGAAVLAAAGQIAEARAVVTIGAPASPEHVQKQFACDLDTIRSEGVAQVSLAGRSFTIKRQFLEDIDDHRLEAHVQSLRRALLVFHSPLDTTVSIEQAAKIYQAAKHPKSFISLDQADHLLTRKEDAEYVGAVIAAWASRYLDAGHDSTAQTSAVAGGEVLVSERNRAFLRGVSTDDHYLLADEPTRVGGSNIGADPYELLLASLGACTSMTIRMYANRKQFPLKDVQVVLRHNREHAGDCEDCESASAMLDVITREIRLTGDLTDEQRQRLLEIADRCPVHKTLHNQIQVRSILVD